MKITYKTKTIEKVCTDVRTAERKHGSKMAEKISQRLDEIRAADTGQFAVDLVHPYRLVFEKNGEEIQIANIIEIVDYH
ncbi:MAG: plasmid maintenance system killer protein [Clostridiales bacterium 44_9]|nr:MAG: plasmid maintenance system killer protein [Clostridiales bacterium 44_9]